MPHKIFVHSKARVNPSHSSHSNFSYQLPAPIEVPQSRCIVDQVHLPNEFATIHALNKFVYIEERVGTTPHKRKIALQEGTYDADTLPTQLASALNTGTNLAAASYACSFDSATGRLQISTSDTANTFYIWTEGALDNGLWSPLGSPSIPSYIEHDHAYDVIGFHSPTPMPGSLNAPVDGTARINVTPFHTLYIHSSLGSQQDSVGPMGNSSIIRTVCLDQPLGRYVHDRSSMAFDYVSVGQGQLRQMDFKLCDWRGRPVALTNSWSFSLILIPEETI